ncbi:MAG: FtsH protease activity modulator HflK [Deltaproteobacteria bacterium]|nr:FtsH protease activity modulator HflK [Deltaproteobacteria bacterium]
MANAQWPGELKDDLRRLQQQFEGFNPGFVLPVLLVVVVLLFLWSSWYTVQPEETAVVQRFGRVHRTTGPGLHFKIPLGIETVRRVPTARVLKEEFGFRTVTAGRQTQYAGGDYSAESLMLTGDLNVIDVQWIVQFRVEDPVRFLFKVREQQDTFRAVSEAVMRRVVGNRVASDVLTVGRVGVAGRVKEEIQQILSDYETGIRLITVELQDVTPPDQVKPAYNEVNEARQDLERMVNQAQEQANKVIPRAAGEAKQAVAEAEGYATERVNRARGEAARFTSVLAEYQRVPDVTRRRLYLEAMSEVLADAKTVYIVDSEQQALIPWLSLDSGKSPPPIQARAEEPKS